MLVLTRKRDEGITITLPDGRKMGLTILEIRGHQPGGPAGKVRIGISAPEDVLIFRDEIEPDPTVHKFTHDPRKP